MDKRSIKLIPKEPWVLEFIEGFDFGIIPREYRELIFSKLKTAATIARESVTLEYLIQLLIHTGSVALTTSLISSIVTSTILKKLLDKILSEETLKYLREIKTRK